MALPTITKEIIKKFDVPGPRYTSYPTAPVWSPDVTAQTYQSKLAQFGRSNKTLSLYIHLPFCQTMCTFCACSVLIRKHEEKYSDEYLSHLFREIELVAESIGKRAEVKQFHWGGGTPNFLTPDQMRQLFAKVMKHFDVDLKGEVAIEIDPRSISWEHLETLKELGFNRISMGIQDFNPEVQEAVNRIQPFELVETVNSWCRKLKFPSVNFDLIYGLPFQTIESFDDTITKVIGLKPDRIALYSFAYVPWLKKHQTKMDVATLPSNDTKLDIFLGARERLLANGYQAIAMDHFARENDDMAKAFQAGKLYRNFMGYTVKPADEFIGLGLTSIGFLENTFIQNKKTLSDYYSDLENGELPVERGKELTEDDKIRQRVIRSLICQFRINKEEFKQQFAVAFDSYFDLEQGHIQQCEKDGLLQVHRDELLVSDLGKIFIRNVCMGFDAYLARKEAPAKFSQTV